MLVISHRGNLDGQEKSLENQPEHIKRCIRGLEINVEIDLWAFENGEHTELYLGHDEPQYGISTKWLLDFSNFLWIHCKNMQALVYLHNHPDTHRFNYFWHETDDYTITSKGYIWAYPGNSLNLPSRAIAVMPEQHNIDLRYFCGVCTDNAEHYVTHDRKVSYI